MLPFDPLFRNPHLQTIAGHYWPRPRSETRWPLRTRVVETEPGVKVVVQTQRPAARGATPHLVLVHGLEGSGSAVYNRSLAYAALASGFAVHRFQMRTCGGTERYCQTLYHAGLTSDLLTVLRQIGAPAILIGFSLGGNVVLKLAGELADCAPSLVQAVVGVSTPLDLAACARRIADPDNRIYEFRFVRRMLARLRATGRYSERDLAGLRSVIGIDDRITAPSFGFSGAEHYYRTQSALNFLPDIRVPTLLIQARDDHFIPFSMYDAPAVHSNPRIRLLAPDHGGHLGFLARRPHRFWLDRVILDWVKTL